MHGIFEFLAVFVCVCSLSRGKSNKSIEIYTLPLMSHTDRHDKPSAPVAYDWMGFQRSTPHICCSQLCQMRTLCQCWKSLWAKTSRIIISTIWRPHSDGARKTIHHHPARTSGRRRRKLEMSLDVGRICTSTVGSFAQCSCIVPATIDKEKKQMAQSVECLHPFISERAYAWGSSFRIMYTDKNRRTICWRQHRAMSIIIGNLHTANSCASDDMQSFQRRSIPLQARLRCQSQPDNNIIFIIIILAIIISTNATGSITMVVA